VVGEIPLYLLLSHENIFDHQENSKTQGGKGQIRKNGGEIKGFLHTWRFPYSCGGSHTHVEVPILVCSPSVQNSLGLPFPGENPLEWKLPLQPKARRRRRMNTEIGWTNEDLLSHCPMEMMMGRCPYLLVIIH